MVGFGPNFVDDAGIPEGNVPAGSFGDVVDCLGNVVDKSDVDYHKGIVDSFFVNDLLASFGDIVDCLGNVVDKNNVDYHKVIVD